MRFVQVGAGVVGAMRARAVVRTPGVELVAVADIDLERARELASSTGARALENPAEALTLSDADAVILSTPGHLHEEAVVTALAAGKHVLCEKPLATAVEPCRRMVHAARDAGRILATGFNYRYFESVKFLKKVLDEGRIGTVDHIRAFGGHDGLANFRAEWMYQAEHSGGGATMDIGLHVTDLVRFVAGDVVRVYGVARNRIWGVEGSEDEALALLETESGVPVSYQATWNEWKGYRFVLEAYGDRGMVRAYYAPMFNHLITHERPGGKRTHERHFYPGTILREKLRGWESTTGQAFADEIADLVARAAGKEVPLADGVDGLRAVEISRAVRNSSISGEPVTLQPHL